MSDALPETAETQAGNPHSLARWVIRLLNAQIFVAAMAVASGYFEFLLLEDFRSGLYASREQMVAAAQANDLRQAYITIVSAIIFIVAGITILRWIYQVACRAAESGKGSMRHSPIAAVAWFFVPVANLWKPYQVMKAIWQTSADCAGRQRRRSSGHYLLAWWLLWLMNAVLIFFAIKLGKEALDLGDLLLTNVTTLAADVVLIATSMAFMAIVREIDLLQSQCREPGLPQA